MTNRERDRPRSKKHRAQHLYVFLLRADQLGALGILASGAEGAARQAAAIDHLDGVLVTQLAVAGPYDVLIVATFPSSEAAYAFGMLQTGAGFYCETMLAYEPPQVDIAAKLLEPLLASLSQIDTKERPESINPKSEQRQ